MNLKLANGKDLARNEVGLIKSKIYTEIPIPVVPGVNSDSGLWISGKIPENFMHHYWWACANARIGMTSSTAGPVGSPSDSSWLD